MIVTTSKSQTFAEWFKQKKTQKKYLVEQIAALQLYIGYVKKGYTIAKKGLRLIGDIKNGEFNLHTDYFNSLKKVNPKVKNYAKIADIVAVQLLIVQECKGLRKKARESSAFNGEELEYIGRVLVRLLEDGTQTLDELITVTTDGKLELKDEERLHRIDKLYKDMTGQFTFIKSFSNETMLMAASRINENKEVQTSRVLYGIKQN